ncbi:CPBP family intramembrane metalloprotease [Candidatus Sumerlaeota bacterium]|nr:CPBP family intramembrane metalloprotease [Candidatus Sumerlaeota bacterium]
MLMQAKDWTWALQPMLLLIAAQALWRYRRALEPVVQRRWKHGAWIGVLLFIPAGVCLLHGDTRSAAWIGSEAAVLTAFFPIVLLGGYVCVRRSPGVWNSARREDRALRSWLREKASRAGHRRYIDPLRGVLAGLVLLFVSLCYFAIVFYFYPDANITLETFLQIPLRALVYHVLLSAVWEELLYRWLLMHWLLGLLRRVNYGRWIAIALSALIWAVGHATGYADPPWIKVAQVFLLGVLLGAAYPRLGLEGCIVAHFTMNLITMLAMGL